MKKRGIIFMLSGGIIYLLVALIDSFGVSIPNALYIGFGVGCAALVFVGLYFLLKKTDEDLPIKEEKDQRKLSMLFEIRK